MDFHNESFAQFVRLVDERHADVVVNLNALLESYACRDHMQSVESSKVLLKSLSDLVNSVSRQDRPEWLVELLVSTKQLVKRPQDGGACTRQLNLLIKHKSDIEAHAWDFDSETIDPTAEFDAVVERFVDESRIHELIDKLIATLTELLDSGNVDSVKAIESLRALLATLKGSRKRSFYGKMAAIRFVRTFGREVLTAYLKRNNVIGSVMEGWEATVNELDEECNAVRGRLKDWSETVSAEWTEKMKPLALPKPEASKAAMTPVEPIALNHPKNDGSDEKALADDNSE